MSEANPVPDPRALVGEVLAAGSGARLRHHGERHWKRVAALGLDLLGDMPRADPMLVFLFSLLHDAGRVTDRRDPGHGERGAELARRLRADGLIVLSGERMALLERACIRHDDGVRSNDSTLGVCFDADRLDLHRLRITPSAWRLSTSAAKSVRMNARAKELQRQRVSWWTVAAGYGLL